MAVSVPYDVVLEIYLRVKDVVTLFRCATTCKGWRRLLTADPSFLRRCLTDDVCRSAPFAGFFTERRLRRGFPAPCLVPPARPVLDPCCRPLSFFLPNIDDRRFFDHAVPLASRHSLVLVRLDTDPRCDLLGVCNLITGIFDVLPRLEHNGEFHDHGYAILAGTDCSSNNDQQELWALFKVLVISIRGSENTAQYRLHTFSSAGEPRWNMCARNVQGNYLCAPLWQHSAVVCCGLARWLFWGMGGIYTFDVSVETNHFSFTMISMKPHDLMYPHYEPYISVDSKERLTLFLQQRRGPQLEIWTLRNNKRWTCARMLMLRQLNQHKETQSLSYTCLAEKSGTLLIKDNYHHVFFADSMTGVMQKVKNWPDKCNLSRKKTVPLDMDWQAFFLSRLKAVTTGQNNCYYIA